MENKRQDRERGMLTVEAVMTLVPFILLVLGLISFINVFMVHNKIQYSMYQTAHEISAYTYLYSALGIQAADKKVYEDQQAAYAPIKTDVENVTKLVGEIKDLGPVVSGAQSTASSLSEGDLSALSGIQDQWNNGMSEINDVKDAWKPGTEGIKNLVSNPQAVFTAVSMWLLNSGKEWAKTQFLAWMTMANMEDNLESSLLSGAPSADEFLLQYGVIGGFDGLDFSNSHLFSDPTFDKIDIVCEYDLEVYFFKLIPMKDNTIHVIQRVQIPGWLEGDGVVGDFPRKPLGTGGDGDGDGDGGSSGGEGGTT